MDRPVVSHVWSPADALPWRVDRIVDLCTATRSVAATSPADARGTVMAWGSWAAERTAHHRGPRVVALAGEEPPSFSTTLRGVAAVVVPTLELAARLRPRAPGAVVVVPSDHSGTSPRGDAEVMAHGPSGVVADLERLLVAVAAGRPAPPTLEPLTTRPCVSVVVCTYRRAELLRRCLDALDAQTWPAERREIVVVDNGSDDETAQLLQARPDLRVVRLPRNVPPALARNAGVRASTGDVVAFTDDDCRPVATWLDELVGAFRHGVALVQGRTMPDPAQAMSPMRRSQSTPAEHGLYETCNIAYDRRVLDRVAPAGPFSDAVPSRMLELLGGRLATQAFGEDVDLGWRVRRAGGETRFAAAAIVHHEVFDADVAYLLQRAVLAAGFPELVRRYPELRETFLSHGVALGPHRWRVWAGLVALVVATRRPGASVGMAPWAWQLLRPDLPGRRTRIRHAPGLAARDLVETAALVYGSLRARRIVL